MVECRRFMEPVSFKIENFRLIQNSLSNTSIPERSKGLDSSSSADAS